MKAIRPLIAECLGTFMMVFAGTGAIVIDDASGGAITHLGIALTFGLIVLAVIYAYGDLSGAHINPAVTLGFWAAGRFPSGRVAPYILSQSVGAVLASAVLAFLFPAHETLGATLPSGDPWHSFVMELILTWWLMTVILGVSTGAKEKGLVAGIVVGAVVALEALFGGPVSGASMNPARSLGPALVSGTWQHFWIYATATILGSLTAVVSCRWVQGEACCRPGPDPENGTLEKAVSDMPGHDATRI